MKGMKMIAPLWEDAMSKTLKMISPSLQIDRVRERDKKKAKGRNINSHSQFAN
jgi:hypothetical protein